MLHCKQLYTIGIKNTAAVLDSTIGDMQNKRRFKRDAEIARLV